MKHREYIPEFDGFRGISILLVMLFHFWVYDGTAVVGKAVSYFARVGWAGVDVFFVLSGFLITKILLSSRDSPHYWRNFYIRRSLRIFPLYYSIMTIMLLGALAVKAFGISIDDPAIKMVDHIWISFLYLTNFAYALYGKNYVPMDIVWSLAVEEQFYLIYPFIVRYASAIRLKQFLITAIVLAPMLRVASFVATDGRWEPSYVLLSSRMDALAIGGLLVLVLRDHSDVARQRIASAAPWIGVAALLTLLTFNYHDVEVISLGYSLVALAAAAMMLRVLQYRELWFSRLLRNRALVYIGQISYGLYLLHLIGRVLVDQIMLRGMLGVFREDFTLALLRLTLLMGTAVILATISYYSFESPILRLKERFAASSQRHP
jgi:peptidoglycan/LPS O-acetylase OafA/YrhL